MIVQIVDCSESIGIHVGYIANSHVLFSRVDLINVARMSYIQIVFVQIWFLQ